MTSILPLGKRDGQRRVLCNRVPKDKCTVRLSRPPTALIHMLGTFSLAFGHPAIAREAKDLTEPFRAQQPGIESTLQSISIRLRQLRDL